MNGTVLQVGANSIVAQYSGDTSLAAATGTISVPVTSAASGSPVISGMAHGASFARSYAPGMVLSIFGTNLAGGSFVASNVPLPVQASSVRVTINGVSAPLYYVSPAQMNVQIPYETPLNRPVTVTVNNNGLAGSATLTVAATAPGLFTDGAGNVVPAATAARGSVVSLFITGAGAVSPAVATARRPRAAPVGRCRHP